MSRLFKSAYRTNFLDNLFKSGSSFIGCWKLAVTTVRELLTRSWLIDVNN